MTIVFANKLIDELSTNLNRFNIKIVDISDETTLYNGFVIILYNSDCAEEYAIPHTAYLFKNANNRIHHVIEMKNTNPPQFIKWKSSAGPQKITDHPFIWSSICEIVKTFNDQNNNLKRKL